MLRLFIMHVIEIRYLKFHMRFLNILNETSLKFEKLFAYENNINLYKFHQIVYFMILVVALCIM